MKSLAKNFISALAEVVIWVDKLVGTFTILEPNMGAQIGQSGGSTNVVNLYPNFLPKIKSFSGKPEEGWNFLESFLNCSPVTWTNNLLLLPLA